ncbi:hypothetical protein AGMMS49546_14060 [Spirochaetia bacterium]|nr:hypothetical protein AGMMS49546_14050 [Spirochaetia bacterium]GHV40344.1 hypothetical protein AGMMS49546_14060 [Spirochaetia bacterium]
MQNKFSFMTIMTFVVIASVTLFSCDGESNYKSSPSERFHNYLQESWVSIRTPYSWETKGRLVIGYNSITISGSIRPFNIDYSSGYTKDIALKGYSEESSSAVDEKRGILFIRDKGTLKSVPYVRWRAANIYMLTVGTTPDDETFRQE